VRRYLADEKEWEGYSGPNITIANDGQGVNPEATSLMAAKTLAVAERLWAK
jgi:hypothetical protein